MPGATTTTLAGQTTRFIQYFVVVNIVLWILFAFARLAFMTPEHFVTLGNTDLAWTDALYTSLMVQTTIGNSAVLPKSNTAKLITTIQSLCLFLSLLAVSGCCFFGNCAD